MCPLAETRPLRSRGRVAHVVVDALRPSAGPNTPAVQASRKPHEVPVFHATRRRSCLRVKGSSGRGALFNMSSAMKLASSESRRVDSVRDDSDSRAMTVAQSYAPNRQSVFADDDPLDGFFTARTTGGGPFPCPPEYPW